MLIRSQPEYISAVAYIAKLEALSPPNPERARLEEIKEAIEAWECVNRLSPSPARQARCDRAAVAAHRG